MANMSGDWGHNDWNGNGEYDSYDNMLDHEYEEEFYGGGSGGYHGASKSGGSGKSFLVVMAIGLVLGLINELLGAIFLFFYLWYSIFFK